jgi:hypothetical protein
VARIQINYRSLRFADRDQSVDAIQTILEDEHLSPHQAHEISGLAAQTITNWISGKTKRPQNITLAALSSSLGYVRRDDIDEDGKLIMGYRKARKLDYVKEREKQATFMIAQGRGPKKKPRRKKKRSNGSGAKAAR